MTFHMPWLMVCVLDCRFPFLMTFRYIKNDRFRVFFRSGTIPFLFCFCGASVFGSYACTIPLRLHIPFVMPRYFEFTFDLPSSDSDRHFYRRFHFLAIQSLVPWISPNLQLYQPLYHFYFTV